jgi:cell division protein FtsI (penicillin-binding protein 3)
VDSPTVGSRYGGIVAAPAFAEIAAFSMRYLGVPPDPPAEPSPEVASEATPEPAAPAPLELLASGDGVSWIMPDLAGRSMRASLAGIQAGGFDLEVRGSGRLVEQVPGPGVRLAAGDPVKLRFD